jgi:hypothetical protein
LIALFSAVPVAASVFDTTWDSTTYDVLVEAPRMLRLQAYHRRNMAVETLIHDDYGGGNAISSLELVGFYNFFGNHITATEITATEIWVNLRAYDRRVEMPRMQRLLDYAETHGIMEEAIIFRTIRPDQ